MSGRGTHRPFVVPSFDPCRYSMGCSHGMMSEILLAGWQFYVCVLIVRAVFLMMILLAFLGLLNVTN